MFRIEKVSRTLNGKSQTPTLAGHPFAPIGVGENIRCSFRAFRAASFPLPVRDIFSSDNQLDYELAEEIGPHLVRELSPSINLFYINGNEVEQVLAHLSQVLPPCAYNVVFPMWELSSYPREWGKQLDRFDEIWAPSKFVFDSVREAVSKPVVHMPLPVEVRITSHLGRRYFHIPESAFVFLFFFDFRSYIDRKNPFAVIEAFEKLCAVRPREDVRLVIKLNRPGNVLQANADFQRFAVQVDRSRHSDKIIVIDKVLTDNETKNLVRCCDCFVSLHRSEGFGRVMAEAMYLGKPVVATGYSGNLDFMNEQNSCLVNYNLIDVEEDSYPFAEGQIWAEPDIEHAVQYMLSLLDNRNHGWQLGQIASQRIRTYFSYRAVGLTYKRRLTELLNVREEEAPRISVEGRA